MGETSENKPINHIKHINLGIVAHVDAGKTTLSESILYTCGAIRQMGRVDHGDTFLDTYSLEKDRGITIFSKQAQLTLHDLELTLLDTPGHVDFSAEMERTLQVLDYAVLIISGADGVQGHTQTLWNLLKRYRIPVFLFVNKMDQLGTDRTALMEELKRRLDSNCLDFSADTSTEEWQEQIAMCDEGMLEHYLETGELDTGNIPDLIAARKLFPCYFGSALHQEGVEGFLQGLYDLVRVPKYPSEFGAKVFKIGRDNQGTRLTYMKITGGSLRVKAELSGGRTQLGDAVPQKAEQVSPIVSESRGTQADKKRQGNESSMQWTEKADQIRVYSGDKYELIQEANAGCVCAVTGLTQTYPGQGLGVEKESELPVLEPVLTYQIRLPEGCDVHQTLIKLRMLEEEEPLLHIVWNEELSEIHAQVMGEIQIEILKSLIKERFGLEVTFDSGNIVYKETIARAAEGVGHFEPLRHYAEVHLLLEPLEAGSGLLFDTDCSEDSLDRNWQRLILTHLEEKVHRGVLIGAPITDMKITLVAGRAHLKHTEGGDFRQATYRAVRQGLRKTESVLMEPWYAFRLEVPAGQIGRAMTDVQKMYGTFAAPEMDGEYAVLTGEAPVVTMRDYQREMNAYTGGRGRIFCSLKGYLPCHNAEEVIADAAYDPEADLANPTGSVFCAHGAGFVVNWDQVEDYMHVESGLELEAAPLPDDGDKEPASKLSWKEQEREYQVTQKELEEIFERTYGPIKPRAGEYEAPRKSRKGWKRSHRDVEFAASKSAAAENAEHTQNAEKEKKKKEAPQKEYLLVDGYNIIYAWEDLNELSKVNIDGARTKLMDILCNYQGYKNCTLILVFDAYKVKGNSGSVEKYHNIYVVYTKEAETADQYIEKAVHDIGRKYQVRVATSDNLEQMIILGQGGSRISAREFRVEIEEVQQQIRMETELRRESGKNYLFDHLDRELADYVEDIRLGRNTDEE